MFLLYRLLWADPKHLYLRAFGGPSPAQEIALVSLEDALEKVRMAVKKARGENAIRVQDLEPKATLKFVEFRNPKP